MSSTRFQAAQSARNAWGASSVALASAWSAVVMYVVMTSTARVLAVEETTLVLTFLAVLFATYGVLAGVALEITRAVAAATRDAVSEGPIMWHVAAAVSLTAALVVLASSPFWAHNVLHDKDAGLVAAMVLAMLAYGFHCVLAGAASGRALWGTAALVLGGEATLRLLLTGGVIATGPSATSLGMASAGGAWAALILLAISTRARGVLRLRADSSAMTLVRRMVAALLAQGASSLLVVGFPILLAASTPTSAYRSAAPLLLAVSLTRAPMLLPLNALQGVAISHLVRADGRVLGLTLRLLAIVTAVGAVGGLLAWLVGPVLMTTMFGAAYEVSGPVLGGLTLAAAATAALTITGACTQAMAAHGWYVAGWLVAVGLCVLLLQTPGSMESRTLLALGLAPLGGLLVHVVGMRRARLTGQEAKGQRASV